MEHNAGSLLVSIVAAGSVRETVLFPPRVVLAWPVPRVTHHCNYCDLDVVICSRLLSLSPPVTLQFFLAVVKSC